MMPFVFCPYCATPMQARLRFGKERRTCPACNFTQFQDPKVATSVLISEGDRVLLIRRAVPPRAGYWALPAGFVEADELPEQTAVREVHEETGLHVVLEGLVAVRRMANPDKPGFLMSYRGRVVGGALQAQDDVSDARWFAAGDIPWDDLAFPTTHEMLRHWLGEAMPIHHPAPIYSPQRRTSDPPQRRTNHQSTNLPPT